MQHDITKLCADSLRAFTLKNYGIQLKSSHAHELVSASLGYLSRAALLADTSANIANLQEAEFIVLNPDIRLMDERRNKLEGLSPDLPASHILVEGIYSVLVTEKSVVDKAWPSLRDLALHIAEERRHQDLRMLGIDPKVLKFDVIVDMKHDKGETLVTVDMGYCSNSGERLKDRKYDITFTRVAANLGYTAKVHEARYAGEARRVSF